MAILGQDISASLIARTRSALCEAINKRLALRDTSFVLTRQAYTGDYVLKGFSQATGFFPIAKFGMLPLPGCHAICIFHHSWVELAFRSKGIGKKLLQVREEAAKLAGYKVAMCTVRIDNEVENHILRAAGWSKDYCFPGAHAGDVAVLFKSL